MVMLNDLDRFHLVIDVIDRVPGLARSAAARLRQEMRRPPASRARLHARARRGRPRDPRLGLAVLSSILVVNAGSTSLKLSLVAGDESAETLDVARGVPAERRGRRAPRRPRRRALPRADGDRRRRCVAELERPDRARAAPQRARARGDRRGASARCPDVPHVAVFDTAFHATIPPEARTYALPAPLARGAGHPPLRIPRALGRSGRASRCASPRLVVCHLGGGCSVTAVRDGRSVDTTMGFTPLEGVPMATRSGSVDPGALLYLLREHGLTVDELDHALEHESGLLGLSGLGRRARARTPPTMTRRSSRSRSSPTASRAPSPPWRSRSAASTRWSSPRGSASTPLSSGALVCARLAYLGVELDEGANDSAEPDAEIARPGSAVRVVVLRAREDLVAARAARSLLLVGQ